MTSIEWKELKFIIIIQCFLATLCMIELVWHYWQSDEQTLKELEK